MNSDTSQLWPSSGYSQLRRNARGWLEPGVDYLRLFLSRPELALVPESCAAEQALHASLLAAPLRAVSLDELQAVQDADARENYSVFLAFRDALMAAGTLEACYLKLFRQGAVTHAPLFIDLLAQAVVRHLLDGVQDPLEWRAGEMLFRQQRIASENGQLLAGDSLVLDLMKETGGFGDIGRLLVQSKAPMDAIQMRVLTESNAEDYWAADERHIHLLDLSHDPGRLRHGLHALARVLEKWIRHFLGVTVSIRPQQQVQDTAWRWHVGLDVESTALLNDLYEGREIAPERQSRMLSLFRLDFANPREMREDVAGKPVYLGLAMKADNTLRLKPQNLLLNLPLARAM